MSLLLNIYAKLSVLHISCQIRCKHNCLGKNEVS